METLAQLQEETYTKRQNYKTEYTEEGDRDTVAVYLTSNALFFPNTAEVFREAVLTKDRYEWTRLRIRRAYKHVFVRDVYKQWYASGINAQTNTVDKLIDLLREETAGYNCLIITGSSGGGTLLRSSGRSSVPRSS